MNTNERIITKDEVARVPQEIFDEINHGDFIRG